MTTKHHRTPEERAEAVFRPTLKRLEAKAAKSKARWEQDEAAAEKVRKKIAMLNQLPLPEMPEPIGGGTDPTYTTVTVSPDTSTISPDTRTDAPSSTTLSETPLADARAGARERVAVRRAALGKCPHGKVEGWCSKPECQSGEVKV